MNTTIADPKRRLNSAAQVRQPGWLWLNLLGLDAPLVALLWQALFARSYGIELHWPAVVSLAMAVWLIYLVDRLLDTRSPAIDPLLARHQFARAHMGTLVAAVFVATVALLWSCAHLAPPILRNGLAMAATVALYFVLVHSAPMRLGRYWPKELAVGVLFAVGTGLATWSKMGAGRERLVVPVLLFAGLCWVNCVAIEYWEWRVQAPPQAIHLWTRSAGERLGQVAAVVATIAGLLLALEPPRLAFAATLLSAAAFVWLARRSRSLPIDALRVLADVALLSPLLLLGIAR